MCTKFINKTKAICDSKYALITLALFDFLYVFINIFKKTYLLGLIFLALNILILIFLSKRKAMYIIFGLYPFSRVLKIPSLETSLLTIIILVYCAKLLILALIQKEKLKNYDIACLLLYLIYVASTFIISALNKNDSFKIATLISYYLYLSMPILIFVTTKTSNDVNIIVDIIICAASYLFGICTTIFYYKVIPNGQLLLENAGVNVFNMGNAGLRFSPLTDDPNYGTALILLLGSIFIASKKTKKQICIGYPLIVASFIFSCLSISKMFILGLVILLLCLAISIMTKANNLIVNSIIILAIAVSVVLFLSSSIGITLIIRTIGTTGGITLNRITSGRTELFGDYSSYILSNPLTLLFGNGPLYYDLAHFSNGEHNTFTKTIYGSGIFGVTIMLIIFGIMARNRLKPQFKIPRNIFFTGFIGCLLLCCMSLAITPSTVFPILVISAQYADFKNKRREIQNYEAYI